MSFLKEYKEVKKLYLSEKGKKITFIPLQNRINHVYKIMREKSAGYIFCHSSTSNEFTKDGSGSYIRDWFNINNGIRDVYSLDALLKANKLPYYEFGQYKSFLKLFMESRERIEDSTRLNECVILFCAIPIKYARFEKFMEEKEKIIETKGIFGRVKQETIIEEIPVEKWRVYNQNLKLSQISTLKSDEEVYAIIFLTNDNLNDTSGRLGTGISGVILTEKDVIETMMEMLLNNPAQYKIMLKNIFSDMGEKLIKTEFNKLYVFRYTHNHKIHKNIFEF